MLRGCSRHARLCHTCCSLSSAGMLVTAIPGFRSHNAWHATAAVLAYSAAGTLALGGIAYRTWQLSFAGLVALAAGLLLVGAADVRRHLPLFRSSQKGVQSLGYGLLVLAGSAALLTAPGNAGPSRQLATSTGANAGRVTPVPVTTAALPVRPTAPKAALSPMPGSTSPATVEAPREQQPGSGSHAGVVPPATPTRTLGTLRRDRVAFRAFYVRLEAGESVCRDAASAASAALRAEHAHATQVTAAYEAAQLAHDQCEAAGHAVSSVGVPGSLAWLNLPTVVDASITWEHAMRDIWFDQAQMLAVGPSPSLQAAIALRGRDAARAGDNESKLLALIGVKLEISLPNLTAPS